ncbi:ion channel DMI1 isoform X2 [Benincasa hispida]|uniref:ion channel DMI1 isoform X2 n=1 Tax=Benincasa hispida TaxID=102211 RepID=UPI0019002A82|nr:ion channel DMI1 isoform X2 [Benincasa hispida]
MASDNENSTLTPRHHPNASPTKPDSPPLLKRSKTIAVDTPPHFPGPLFPAVRRVSTAPPLSASAFRQTTDLRLSLDNDTAPTPHGAQFFNRDYIFPSCLGPYASNPRLTLKAPKNPNQDLSTTTSSSNRRIGSSRARGMAAEQSPPVAPPSKVEESKKQEKLNKVIGRPDSGSQTSMGRSWKPTHSLLQYLPIIACMFMGFYVVYLQKKVTKLEEEKSHLHQLCSDENIINATWGISVPGDNYSILNFFNADSRSIALYTVVCTLVMPFILYKYLDYLPRIKNFSERTQNSKDEVPLNKRIAYVVDVCFSIYPYAKLLALLFATVFLIEFGGLALYAVSDGNFVEALWLSWTFVADSGNHADRVGIGPRIVSVSISAGGMLIFAMMLGLVSDAISEKVDSLRKGKSEVIERNHILILGWSDKLGSLLKQLAIANKSIGGGVVVVLAERDKEEMEMDIAKLEFDFMGTSVICRSGSPLILADLKKVSVSKARAIIVLATDENADQSDARALRVVLSLTGVKEGLRGHVVVEMSDLDNEPLVKLVGGEVIETVVAHDVIGRLMIQCALQPGLAQIWEDILGFENSEFYIQRWPQLDGQRFGEVLITFPDAIPCGIKVAADSGKIILNPDDNYILKEGDEVLVIAEDDDTYAPSPIPEVRRGFFQKMIDPPKYPEKILFCGWRRDIDDMIMVLEAILAPGSELWMFNEVPETEREKKLIDGGLDISSLVNIKLVHRQGNAVIRRHLESLPLETFDSILILADESLEDSVVHSDSRSLATLLLIRDIQSKRLPNKDMKLTPSSLRLAGFSHHSWIREMQQASDRSIIISEILDSRTRNLVSVSRISDYVLSNELVSMALAMVAEDQQINRVLEELFAEEGNEMCIRPAEFYLVDQEELCFYDIMIRGRQRREIVIGYKLATSEHAIINPPQKSEQRKWSLDDVFVAISSG